MTVPTVTFNQILAWVEPSVSVIVPIYNGEDNLPSLLDGLLAQTYASDRLEIILVDNGSYDRTPHLLQAAAAQSPQIRHLPFSAIQSSYAARNAGIRAAQGNILAFTDVDCRPAPNWLKALVQPFRDAAVGLVAGEIKARPGTHWLERYAHRQDTLSQRHTLNHPYLAYGQTANLAIRADSLKQVGLFRPHLTTGGDADICWRIQQQTDWRMVHAVDAVVDHRHRSTLEELWQQWYRYGCSNRYLHDLYGVELMRSLTLRESGYRLARWLGKELPQGIWTWLLGQSQGIDCIVTPLDLWCFYARTQGQGQVGLPPQLHCIESMEESAGGKVKPAV